VQQLRDEHDRVCGDDMEGGLRMVQGEPHRIAELELTTAVLKETLRMYPVGFSIRTDDKE
jgi:cytochrome P450